MTFHPKDEPLSEPDADAQRKHPSCYGAERYVGEQTYTKQRVEIMK
jgi:hypothetical protein